MKVKPDIFQAKTISSTLHRVYKNWCEIEYAVLLGRRSFWRGIWHFKVVQSEDDCHTATQITSARC